MRVALVSNVEDALLVQFVQAHLATGMNDETRSIRTRKNESYVNDPAFIIIEEGQITGLREIEQFDGGTHFRLLVRITWKVHARQEVYHLGEAAAINTPRCRCV